MIEESEFNSFAGSQEDAEKEIAEKIGQLDGMMLTELLMQRCCNIMEWNVR